MKISHCDDEFIFYSLYFYQFLFYMCGGYSIKSIQVLWILNLLVNQIFYIYVVTNFALLNIILGLFN